MTTLTNITPLGFHAIVDCANCDPGAIQNETTIRAWLEKTVSLVTGTAVGTPVVASTGTDTEGLAVLQLLDIGYISAKFVNSKNHAYIDIFSMKEILIADVETATRSYFGADVVTNKALIPRNAEAIPPQ